ncbi:hypothetical protein C1H76_0249 [Elsinoe australis]|uniref:Uncharacterized protein n=1 Tax=Elsinoe australis TaxID=40998 RepID=A0A4V6DV93_9PEZI|nr:hypothetical protein C1H76_0249 [Elsinoe australis]
MEGRPLPGFYWDKEKKKYFRIQPNHRAPAGAKHSVENVRKEEQATKKRKREHQRQAKVARETVKRAPILTFYQSRVSLGRELGLQAPRLAEVAKSKAFASQIRPEDSLCLHACADCGSSQIVYDYAPVHSGRAIVTGVGDENSAGVSINLGVHENRDNVRRILGGIRSQLTSVNVTNTGLILASATSCRSDNIFITKLPDNDRYELDDGPYLQMRVGKPHYEIRETSVRPGLGSERAILIRNTENFRGAADVLDINEGRAISSVKSAREMRTVDWLNENTGAIGTMQGQVVLMDMRSRDLTVRFQNTNGILSVRGQGDGNGLWVADKDRISLFDVRMPVSKTRANLNYISNTRTSRRRPQDERHEELAALSEPTPAVFSIPALNPTGQAEMAVWHGTGLLASRTENNEVALYSCADGSYVNTKKILDFPCHRNRYWMKKLKCGTTEQGVPTLYYAIGTEIQSLKYGREVGLPDTEAWSAADKAEMNSTLMIRVVEAPVKIKQEPVD